MQRIFVLVPAIFWLLPVPGQAQAWKWAKSLGSANTVTNIKSTRSYAGTSVLLSGSFAAPNLAVGNQTLPNAGQDDGFVAIANENGQYEWAAGFGGLGRDFAVDAAAAPNGDFVVAGNFTSIFLTIGGTNLANSGETDIFLAKFNADKTLAWARKIGSPDVEEAGNVAVDADGNTYVSGHVLNKFTNALQHVFVQKLDAAGNLVWERKGDMNSGIPQTTLALDDDRNIFLSGSVYGHATFGNTTLTSDTSYGAFIVKYSPSGSLLQTYLNTSLDKMNSLLANGGHLYACAEKTNWGLGWGWPLADSKTHTLKFDLDLNLVWYKTAGGENMWQSLDVAKNLSADPVGNIYVAGFFFSDTLQFAGQALTNPFNLEYYYPQIFVLKYSSLGDELWGKAMGGIHSDEAACIYAFGDDQFYLGGNFESNPATFGTYSLHNTGTLDSIYVHLRPARFGRKAMGFLAAFDKNTSSTLPEPAVHDIAIFPNPTSDQVTLRWKSPATSPLVFQLFAADGRLLCQKTCPDGATELSEDTTGLLPGMYFVHLRAGESVFSGKFVKW